jgi:hypothetical protein
MVEGEYPGARAWPVRSGGWYGRGEGGMEAENNKAGIK